MFLLRCPAVDIHVTGTVAKNTHLKNKECYTEKKRQCVGAEELKKWTLSLFCPTRWSHKPVWWQHSMLQPSSPLIMSLHATSSCWELAMCKFLSSVTLAEHRLWPTLPWWCGSVLSSVTPAEYQLWPTLPWWHVSFLSSVTLSKHQRWPTLPWWCVSFHSSVTLAKYRLQPTRSQGWKRWSQFSVMWVLTHRHACTEEKEKVAHFWWCWSCSRWKRRRKKRVF